jgi:hypothetical protein
MTSGLFQDWLKETDKRFRLQDRKVLLVLNNFLGHTAGDYRPTNIEMIFLSPNLTSHRQPLDQGIIANLKLIYYKLKAILTAEKVELEMVKPFDIDQLAAMVLIDNA